MMCRADTIGVFQVESRAQMSMLPRLKPQQISTISWSKWRSCGPGPIQGDMVHPYLKNRELDEDKIAYPKRRNCDKTILKRTHGVPLFQEQAMQIAIDGAGFSPAKADKLRRAMATFRRAGTIHKLKKEFIERHAWKNEYDARVRRTLLQADRGLRRVRLPRKPCRELRDPGLRLVLGEMLLSRGLLLPPCSTPSRWASMRRPSSCAMPRSTGSRCGRPT